MALLMALSWCINVALLLFSDFQLTTGKRWWWWWRWWWRRRWWRWWYSYIV